MLQVDLRNIQAIESASIVFQENSITEFSGDNSNGKSIISKVIQTLTSGDIKNKDIRRTLIKDGTNGGVVLFTHNKEQLLIVLMEEISQCYVSYTPNSDVENEDITRPLSDSKGVDKLIRKFGFRTYADGDICLQLSPTWGAIPFITTNGAVNNDIVQDITVDKVAQSFLDSFKTITLPAFRKRLKDIETEKEYVDKTLDVLEEYDWREYESIIQEMEEVAGVTANYKYIQLQPISLPIYDVEPIVDLCLKSIVPNEILMPAPNICPIGSLSDLVSIYNKVCPTCGRSLID